MASPRARSDPPIRPGRRGGSCRCWTGWPSRSWPTGRRSVEATSSPGRPRPPRPSWGSRPVRSRPMAPAIRPRDPMSGGMALADAGDRIGDASALALPALEGELCDAPTDRADEHEDRWVGDIGPGEGDGADDRGEADPEEDRVAPGDPTDPIDQGAHDRCDEQDGGSDDRLHRRPSAVLPNVAPKRTRARKPG